MDSETVLAIVFGAALAVFSLVMVCYSFVRGRKDTGPVPEFISQMPRPETADNDGPSIDGPSIDSIYESIHTLELEYQLGNLLKPQFQEQFQAYRLQAAAALKEQLENSKADPLWLLEQEVMEARSAMHDNEMVVPVCPDCSGPVPAEASECPHCGAELAPQRAANSIKAQADENR